MQPLPYDIPRQLYQIRMYEVPTWTPSIFGPNPMSREKKLAAKERKRLAKLRRKQGR